MLLLRFCCFMHDQFEILSALVSCKITLILLLPSPPKKKKIVKEE